MFATEYVYHSIKYEKTVGIINENEEAIRNCHIEDDLYAKILM